VRQPGERASILNCAAVAFLLQKTLEQLKLKCFPKVSGSKGIQVYIPLSTATTYDATQPFARALAELLARECPKLAITAMAKPARQGKVFIDWSQNAGHKTTVSVYSLRAKDERPYVSMPVTWKELERAVKKGDSQDLYFEPDRALERLERTGDLFADVLPPPSRAARSQTGHGRFVIQKHAASHFHYDFRLEMHGALKSWAVPKGMPYSRAEKRVAMATEDHPLAYLEFEGAIPKGQYGGGTVMVWDIGDYELIDGDYYKGILRFSLQGKKLQGEWVLARTGDPRGNKWLLIKVGSAMKPLRPKRGGCLGAYWPQHGTNRCSRRRRVAKAIEPRHDG